MSACGARSHYWSLPTSASRSSSVVVVSTVAALAARAVVAGGQSSVVEVVVAGEVASERELEVRARYKHVKGEPRLDFSRQAKPASNFLVAAFLFRSTLDAGRTTDDATALLRTPTEQQKRSQRARKNLRGRDQGSSLTGPRLFSVFACSWLGSSRCYGVTIVSSSFYGVVEVCN